MSKSLLGLILILFGSLTLRAEQPIFNISSIDATPGQIINIDFHVDNFTQIVSAQYSVNWDPAVLDFRVVKNFNAEVLGLSASNFGTPQPLVDAGKFTFGWFESNNIPITIADGSLFFTVEFEVIGDPCDNSPVAISNDPLEIEVAEVGEVQVGLVSNNGEVNVPGSGCAQAINFIGNSVIGPCGGQACIQFTVENFIKVGAIEFSVLFNSDVLQFEEIKNFAPLPGFGNGNTNLLAPGVLRILWFDGNAQNDTLPDGTVLFEICFNVIGTGGQSSEITFSPTPPNTDLNMTISDIDGNFYPINVTPAVVTAQCQLEGFALIADTVCTTPNGDICFDIKINDFDDIVALQFSMNWDSTVFDFDHVEAFGIPGLMGDAFGNTQNGQLVFSWLDLTLNGVTLPDFSTIFRLCLKAKGVAGTSSAISFTANPIDIEVLDAQDSVLAYTLLQGRGEIKVSCDETCSVSYTITTIDPKCHGESNGSVNLTVTESCPESPTYLWSAPGNETTQDLSGKPAGTYTVTITVGSQVIIASATLVDPPSLGVTGIVTPPNPPGSATGAVNITVTGGTPPFTFLWNTVPAQTTEDISGLLAGSYSVTITDNNLCTIIGGPFIVGADLSAAIHDVNCHGSSDGSINLSVSFGTGPYTFLWNTVPAQTTEDISNLIAGTYCVTVTDNGGSTRDSCFIVHEPDAIVLTGTVVNDINENCQGAIDLNVVGGTLPYSYIWSNGAPSQDITALCPAHYCVTVIDGHECIVTMCFDVFAGDIGVSLVATQYGNFQISCNGDCDGEITSVVTGGTSPLTYHWSNGATTPDISSLCKGTYSLTVTDASGHSATSSIVLLAPDPITISFITTSPSDFLTADGAIAGVVNGGVPPYTYQWTGPVGGSTAALNDIPAGTYTLEITDANGCVERASQQVLPDVPVPCYSGIKVITPNDDGANDYFIIACILDIDNHLFIYNRFGGLVYETINYQNTWNGVDQDNEPVPDGGYLWVLEVLKQDGSTQLLKGAVNVLRTAD